MTTWRALRDELGAWARDGLEAKIWWRDDDACAASQPLQRLLALARSHACPLALAVIPARLMPSLGTLLAEEGQGVFVLQHGYAHRNHAPAGQKKAELHATRNREEVAAELAAGGQRLAGSFPERLLAVMVPPWNRIAPEIGSLLPRLGFKGLSAFGTEAAFRGPGEFVQVDCHIDIMRWKPTRAFLGEEMLLRQLIEELRRRRRGLGTSSQPLGLLTHHLVHDEDCWCFLRSLLTILNEHSAVRLVSPADLFPGAAIKMNLKSGGTGEAV